MKWLLVFLCIFKYTHNYLSPIIQVEQGKLVGTEHTLSNGRRISAFLGIPYAAAPVANNRFKEPQEPSWTGLLQATFHRDICLQLQHRPKIIYAVDGSEDCLYLNIYTPQVPNATNQSLLRVLVFIHGGAFMFGSGNYYYPDRILEVADVIFVTFNYRLGILGFFSTNDNEAPGNFGLKDQVAALKWIKKNIINFGGDPESITIIGSSAGSVSVHYHLISPLSEGLFKNAISFSGAISAPWALPENVTQKSIGLGASLNCPTENTTELVTCLRQRSVIEIISASKKFMIWRYTPFTPFGPVIEPNHTNAFLSENPIEQLKMGKVKDIPWIVSMTRDEGLYPAADFIHSEIYLKQLDNMWYQIAPNLLMYNYSVAGKKKSKMSEMIKRFYFNKEPICNRTIEQLVEMLSDRHFFNSIIKSSILHNDAIKSNVFCLKFSYRGERSLTNAFARNKINYGVSHNDDLQYYTKFFKHNDLQTESDKAVAKLMSSFIVNFMESSHPQKDESHWEPITKNQDSIMNCLNIRSADNTEMIDIRVYTENTMFWETIVRQK